MAAEDYLYRPLTVDTLMARLEAGDQAGRAVAAFYEEKLAECRADKERLLEAKAESDAALRQACTNLGTIRPLDMARYLGEDLTIGDAAERWEALVREQARAALAAPKGATDGWCDQHGHDFEMHEGGDQPRCTVCGVAAEGATNG